MADKIVVLNAGEVEQVGTPMELYNAPATPFVAGFIGSPRMNLLDGEVAAAQGCTTYGIRPEHLTVSADEGTWKGTVRHIERLGADSIVYVNAEAAGPIVARIEGSRELREGDPVFVTPMPGKEHRFDRNG